MKNLLTVVEAAEALNLKTSTIRAWLLRRKLPCVHVGRAVRIAAQMIAAHNAALIFVHQSTRPEAISSQQRADDAERACKFLALFIQQIDAMQRLKGKTGRQKVIVEHVHVYEGGQAIVGSVTPRGQGEGVGDGAENN